MATGEKLQRAIEADDEIALRDLVSSVPPTGFGPAELQLIFSPRLDARLIGLNAIVGDLARGRAPRLAPPRADAIHAVSIAHLNDPELRAGVAAKETGTSAEALVDVHALCGDYETIVSLAADSSGYLRGRTNSYREKSIPDQGVQFAHSS